MEEKELTRQAEELVTKLEIVRDQFKIQVETLEFSIRKDVVAVELKDIIANANNYSELVSELEVYIENLLSVKGVDNDEQGDRGE